MEGFTPPEVDNVRMYYKVPRELDEDVAKTVLDREIGAFSYCGTTEASSD